MQTEIGRSTRENISGCRTDEPISILILGDPGLMRESLRTLFSAIPCVQVNGMADLSELSLKLIGEQHPDCVVLESPDTLPDPATLGILNELKRVQSRTRFLIITPSPNQGSIYLTAGADFVLMKGFAFGELKQAFDVLFH